VHVPATEVDPDVPEVPEPEVPEPEVPESELPVVELPLVPVVELSLAEADSSAPESLHLPLFDFPFSQPFVALVVVAGAVVVTIPIGARTAPADTD
jgi:hypothetical protein